MNGATLLAGYILAGIGIALTTAPKGTQPWARVVMVAIWLPAFLVAAITFAIRRGDNL